MQNSRVIRFVVSLVLMYVAWQFVYEYWLIHYTFIDDFLTRLVSKASITLLNVVGYDDMFLTDKNVICNPTRALVYVGHPCNGFELYALHSFFIVAAVGRWLPKLIFISTGILMIYLLNVVRVAALAVNVLVSRASFEFNHHYLFTFIVYGCVFALWVYWLRKNPFLTTGKS